MCPFLPFRPRVQAAVELRARAQLDDRGPRQGAHLHLDEGGLPRRLPQREELRLPQRRVQLRHSAGTPFSAFSSFDNHLLL